MEVGNLFINYNNRGSYDRSTEAKSPVTAYQARVAELERDFVRYSLGIPNAELIKILKEI